MKHTHRTTHHEEDTTTQKKWIIAIALLLVVLISLWFGVRAFYGVRSMKSLLETNNNELSSLQSVSTQIEKMQQKIDSFDAILANLQNDDGEEIEAVSTDQLEAMSQEIQEQLMSLDTQLTDMTNSIGAHGEEIRKNRSNIERFSEVIILDRD